eukprot:g12239.t1
MEFRAHNSLQENFVLRVERLLANNSVRYILQQQQMTKQPEGAGVMESMLYADARRGRASQLEGQDADHGLGIRPGVSMSEVSDKRSDTSEKRLDETRRVLKAPFFKSWEDRGIPITQSDFMLLLEKESQNMQGWDMCVDRKEIKVAKTIQTDGSGCLFLRAWSTLPDAELPVVFHMFHRCEKRMQWDKSFFEMKVVDEIEGSDILYSVLRVPACSSRDYVQYRRTKVLEDAADGTILISLRSANHPELPETSKHVRAESFTSGYVMRRYDDGNEKGTKVFLMTCTDPGEWIDCLKRACLEYQASNPDYESLLKELEPFKEYHSFDFEDMDATVTHGKSGNEEATRILL